MKKLKWTTVKVKVKDLKPLEINPRKMSAKKEHQLQESLEEFDLAEIPVMNTNKDLIAGHQRHRILMQSGRENEEIDVRKPNRKLTEEEVKKYNIISNAVVGEFDYNMIELNFNEDQFIKLIDEYESPKQKVDNLEDGEQIELQQSVQLEPPKEYILIMAEPNSQDWEELKEKLKLKIVRTGGYRKGSLWDKPDLERVLYWGEFKKRFNANSNTK